MYYKIFVLFMLLAGTVSANQYAVQLEASKSPQLERYQHLSVHGKLYTEATQKGFTRARLGPYNSKKIALDVLSKVHEAGYEDAFVAKVKNDAEISASGASRHLRNVESLDVRALPTWQKLTAEQQSNVVYLDNVLHIKKGDKFIPLEAVVSQ